VQALTETPAAIIPDVRHAIQPRRIRFTMKHGVPSHMLALIQLRAGQINHDDHSLSPHAKQVGETDELKAVGQRLQVSRFIAADAPRWHSSRLRSGSPIRLTRRGCRNRRTGNDLTTHPARC
jgi:hypothetical protein